MDTHLGSLPAMELTLPMQKLHIKKEAIWGDNVLEILIRRPHLLSVRKRQ